MVSLVNVPDYTELEVTGTVSKVRKVMGEKVQDFIRINNLILESDFYR